MQPNATELKDSPLLATRDEAKRGHHEATLAQCVRVSGVPNEATLASLSASRLGVNEAKQGQNQARVPPSSFPRRLRRSPRRRRTSHPWFGRVNPQTNDNCPLRHSPADCYIVRIRRARADGNLASQPRVDDRKCNEMQPNATELKVSPLLATPDEANQGHHEATVASFPPSPLGVNEAKQSQMRPFFEISPLRRSPVVPVQTGNLASKPPSPSFQRRLESRQG